MTTAPREKRIPCATYRLQFNSEFPFQAAGEILDYLQKLGITDCYASPLFQASPSSTHGYDVCGFDRMNQGLGGEDGFRDFVARLKKAGLGLLLDMVPNHMGNGPTNKWWVDVLRNGTSSRYANCFDIDWNAIRGPDENSQVLLPVLEGRYHEVLETGKLNVVYEDGSFALRYHDRKFPLNEMSTEALFRDCGVKREAPGFKEAIARHLARINGVPGEPASFDALDRLIRSQHYRLAYWRVGPELINYRRFFDITELVSMKMESEEVFKATHRLLISLVQRGDVTGLRIDHPDGLWNPARYFSRLQETGPVYVVAEKILTGEEALPEDWSVDGTTGYDFLQRVNGLFVDRRNEKAFDDLYWEFVGKRPEPLSQVVNDCKRLVLEKSFPRELNSLTRRLQAIAGKTRYAIDFTASELRQAVGELAVAFPVYRTYVTEISSAVTGPERVAIEEAASRAKAAMIADPDPLEFFKSLLLLDFPEDLQDQERRDALRLVMQFQQLTGPLMAKGLEDTAFYRYNRLASLNEVGGEPGTFGITPEDFHAYNQRMLQNWPNSLLGHGHTRHQTRRGPQGAAERSLRNARTLGKRHCIVGLQ
jgi:(1->4)-alpha-D-glucan 1-alpha-D-glucosylmutase